MSTTGHKLYDSLRVKYQHLSFFRGDEMNHDMHVATGMNQGGVDTNAGMSGEKAMPGSELGGMNQDKSMRVNNGENFATGANSGMETGMGYGTMTMKNDGMGDGMGGNIGMNGAGMVNDMGNGMGNSMGGGVGGGMGNGMGGNMAGVDMRMYMGTIKRSKESKTKNNNSKSKFKTS